MYFCLIPTAVNILVNKNSIVAATFKIKLWTFLNILHLCNHCNLGLFIVLIVISFYIHQMQSRLYFAAPTPASFHRPPTGKGWEDGGQQTPNPNCGEEVKSMKGEKQEDNSKEPDKNISLDKFLFKNTSEDNASFETIMETSLEKNKEKHAWLYEKEKEHALLVQRRLELPTNVKGDQLQIMDRPANLDNWAYTNKNALMYVPECTTLTTEEEIAQAKLQEREIKHANTRLTQDFVKEKETSNSMNKFSENQGVRQRGKFGVDGKETGMNETPNVNGFRFVATPSPAPGSLNICDCKKMRMTKDLMI